MSDLDGSAHSAGEKKKKKKKTKKKKERGDVLLMNSNLDMERSKLFNIRSTQHRGRSLFASRLIEQGTLLFREEPIAMIAYVELCSNCLKKPAENNLLQDESHPHCYYCSEDCMEAFRQQKNIELPIITNIDGIATKSSADPLLLRMVIRILSWQYTEAKKDGLDGSEHSHTKDDIFVDDGNFIVSKLKGFHLMESNLNLQADSWKESLLKAMELILPLLPSDANVSLEELLRIAASVNTNAYSCQDVFSNNEVIGFGIYPFIGSTINHDCYPNCYYSYNNGKLECRAIRNVDNGEELTVTYIDPMDTYDNRKSMLVSTRFFDCLCGRCSGYINYCKPPVNNINMSNESDDDLFARLAQLSDTSISCGYPDALFSGLYCSMCGPGGVMTCPVESLYSPFSCRQCKSSISNALALMVLEESKENLGIVLKETEILIRTDPSKCATLMENWLKTYEGKAKSSSDFSSSNGSGSLVSYNSRKYNGVKLHPCHKLVAEAYIAYSIYLEKAGDMLRSVNTLRHGVESIQLVLPENYPELNNLRYSLACKIDKLLKCKGSTIPQKMKQSLNREKIELINRSVEGKLIAYGVDCTDYQRSL